MSPGAARPRRRGRLSRSGEFDRVYREGTSHANRHVVLYSFPRSVDDDAETRLGVSASRKVGGAVERNKAKRALREAFWAESEHLPPRHDFVLVARAPISELISEEGGAGVQRSVAEAVDALAGKERST